MSEKKAVSAPYYNIGQLRIHYWNNLKNETAELDRSANDFAKAKKHEKLVAQLLIDLESVENYPVLFITRK